MDFFKGISEVFRGKNGFPSYENKDLTEVIVWTRLKGLWPKLVPEYYVKSWLIYSWQNSCKQHMMNVTLSGQKIKSTAATYNPVYWSMPCVYSDLVYSLMTR